MWDKWKTSHAFAGSELFINWPNRVHVPFKVFHDKYSCEKVEVFYAQVFVFAILLIFLDLIELGNTFMFPYIGPNRACFYVKCFQDEEFQKLQRLGKFNGIDYLKSEFKGYQIFYQWKSKYNIREKPVYISHTLKDRLYYNINQGKKYY